MDQTLIAAKRPDITQELKTRCACIHGCDLPLSDGDIPLCDECEAMWIIGDPDHELPDEA